MFGGRPISVGSLPVSSGLQRIKLKINPVLKIEERLPKGFRRYLASTSWLFVERVVSMTIAFAIGTVTANQLGSEDYGKFNFARAFSSIITVFVPLGLNGILSRNLINSPEKRDLIMGTAFTARLCASLVGVLMVVIASFSFNGLYWSDDLKMWMVIIAAMPVVFESFNFIGDYSITHVQAKYHAYGEFAKTIVSSVIKLFMLFVFDSPVIWFAVVLIVDAIVYDIVAITVYTKKFKLSIFQWRASWSYAMEMLKESWPLVLAGFAVAVYMKIDQLMIEPILGDKGVGLYSAALRISESTYFVPAVICNALFPAVIAARKESAGFFTVRMQKLMDLMVLLGFAIAVPITFLSPWIFKYLYAPEYSPAQTVLIIHIWSGIMVGMGIAGSSWLTANNLQRYSLNRTIWGAVVNFGLNLFMIPWLGINGAAIATLFAQTVASYLSNYISPLTRPLFFMQTKSLFGFGFLSPIRDVLGKKMMKL
jgi:O-antigen/teichoic acid export membrane protein